MDCEATYLPTLIRAGVSRHIMHGKGMSVRCLDGYVWLTQQGDQRDITLIPGDTFTIDRNGMTLLVAVGAPAQICIDVEPRQTQMSRRQAERRAAGTSPEVSRVA